MEIVLGFVAFVVIINILGRLGGKHSRSTQPHSMTEQQRRTAGHAAYTAMHNQHRHQQQQQSQQMNHGHRR